LAAVETEDRVARVESLLEEVDALADPAAAQVTSALVQALLDLYGEALGRVMHAVGAAEADVVRDVLLEDELVSHLLFLHDVHPVPLHERVGQALESVRPYLESHGGGVELVGIEEGVVRLRLEGSCSGCPSSTMTLKLAIEEAIHKLAPDVDEIQAEGVTDPAPSPLLKLEISEALGGPGANGNGSGAANGGPPPEAWTTAGSLAELSGGGMVVKTVAGEPVLFIRLISDYFAYRPGCPGCEESLGEGSLRGTELVCGHCDRKYDVHRAGRCLDEPRLHMEPVPLLLEDSGLVKVALGSAVV
jgi:Fe-S cluster biogenesis protein NfuA/nitrite reductase/ring-hydroxylating ferredoxin subunit